MAPCTHVQWLGLVQDHSTASVHHADRLQNIANSLPRPSEQYPSTLLFVGKASKSTALRNIYRKSRISNYRNYGIANICLNPKTANDTYPVLIANASPDGTAGTNPSSAGEKCHETTCHPLDWSTNLDTTLQRQDLVDIIHARLLAMFVDVICIFADDCGGLPGVVAKLTIWAKLNSASSLPSTVRPRVLVVTRMPGETFASEVLRFRSQLFSTATFSSCFSSLNVINRLPKPRSVSQSDFTALEWLLAQETIAARQTRLDSHTLFSTIHLAALFEKALIRFSKTPKETFNFILASRDGNMVKSEFQDHINIFLRLSIENRLPNNIPVPFISSAIILKSFPPGMHSFNPSHVFETLYRPLVLHGFRDFAASQQLSSELICKDIETELNKMFLEMQSTGRSAVDLRIQALCSYTEYWGKLKTTRICLYCLCLQGKLEHVLECNHTICDVCLSTFGELAKGLEYHYNLTTCLICNESICFQGRVMPPTCRARVVSFDGGGCRGIVSLTFFDEMQDAFELDYPIQEHFDFGIGTSSGAVGLAALFIMHWDTKTCLRFWDKFATRVFEKIMLRSTIAKCWWYVASYFADGLYDAVILEEALQEKFKSRRLFGSTGSRPSGMKIAITATTISNATLCLFTNYNGSSDYRDTQCKHIRPYSASDEVLLWEALRCTTAAPWSISPGLNASTIADLNRYYKTKFLPAFGTFQDGGLQNNNPLRPGRREVRRIWKDEDCDIVLSIGTGFKEQLTSPTAPNVRNLFQDGAIARVYRASMSSLSLDSGNSWKDHWHGLEKDIKGQHFRLDVPLKGRVPNIDEVDRMADLQDQVRNNLGDMDGLARAFKAVSFFFELDGPPVREGNIYICRGSILSRSPDSRALVQSITSRYPYSRFITDDEVFLGFLSLDDICEGCGRFQKKVTISVRHPIDVVDLLLCYSRLFRRSISGFPNPMTWFEKRQNLKATFGRADHGESKPLSDSDCSCVHRRRHMDSTDSSTPGKRPLTLIGMRRSKRRRL